MKRLLCFSLAFVSSLLLLTSCSEMSPFRSPSSTSIEESAGVAVQPPAQVPQTIRVLVKPIPPPSSDYSFWSSLLGSEKSKRLNWRDAAGLSPSQLYFVKDGFSINGVKYAGSLLLERDAKGTLRLLNETDMEHYLKGVVPSEMPTSWPSEALKAQAVVARTYALYGLTDPSGFLDNSVLDQVYKSGNASVAANRAVDTTKGEVLTFNGKTFPAYFHSSSGGVTTTIPSVWPSKQNFQVIESVQDPYSLSSPMQNWRTELSPEEIAQAVVKRGYNVGRVQALQVIKRDPTGRVTAIKIVGHLTSKIFDGNDFRLMLGWKNLKSTLYDVKAEGTRFVFVGHGFGHGVGMSQYGAKAMAEKGYNYKQILKFYFPQAELK